MAAPEPAGAGLCLGWEGAPGPRLGAANQARPGPGAAGAPWAHWLARPGAGDSAPRGAPGTPRKISWLPATARPRELLQPSRGLGSPPGSVDRSSSAPLQHPPLNPPLPLNHPPAGGKRGTWLLWEQGTHPFTGLCPPYHPKTGEGRGHGLLTFVSSVSWKSFPYSLIQHLVLTACQAPFWTWGIHPVTSHSSILLSEYKWGGGGRCVCAK